MYFLKEKSFLISMQHILQWILDENFEYEQFYPNILGKIVAKHIGESGVGAPGTRAPTPSESKFLNFHAVFGENWAN